MENEFLKLARRLNLTESEEEYILTPQEEQDILLFESGSKKNHRIWKLRQAGISEPEILSRIAQIDWEKEIDREQILKQANSSKHQNIWHQEQRNNENKKRLQDHLDLVKKCNAEYVYRLMKWTSENELRKPLILNEHNGNLIKALCYFLSCDMRFESELGFSLKKGILIRGVSGLGKTHLVRCVAKNELLPILILSMLEINDEVKENGEYQIQPGENKIVYLDDVGTEEAIVNHYGTKISFFKNFIESIYLKNRPFNKIIISTNNSFSEIEEKYGFRVRSRMKDMFNIIDLGGKDMRG